MINAIDPNARVSLYSQWNAVFSAQASGSAQGFTEELAGYLDAVAQSAALEADRMQTRKAQEAAPAVPAAPASVQEIPEQVAPIEVLRSLSTGGIELAYAFQDTWTHTDTLRGMQAYSAFRA